MSGIQSKPEMIPMPLTPEQKSARARERMLEKAKEFQIGTYIRRFTGPVFQSCIRAEAGADPRQYVTAVVQGEIRQVERKIGQCACVTCGQVGPWKGNAIGGGIIETGHFVASRRAPIVFEETNAHPQCKHCNRHLGGNQGCYEMWMRFAYGQAEIDRLRRLKESSVTFSREELVDMRIAYAARLASAVERMRNG